MTQRNILVTGGAGFIGSHLVDGLVAQGHRVRVLDVLAPQVHGNADGPPVYLNPEAEFVRGTICDAAIVARALAGVEVVYHQAAAVGIGQSMYEIRRYVEANDYGTAILLEEMVKRPDQFHKLVVASSLSIYGEGAYRHPQTQALEYPTLRPASQLAAQRWEVYAPDGLTRLEPIGTHETKTLSPASVYAVTKQNQEQFCLSVGRAYQIPTVALRYFNAYGSRQSLTNAHTGICAVFAARLLKNQAPVIFEDGQQTRDFVHVRDIVQANLLALQTDKADYEAVNIGTGRPLAVKRMAELIAQGLGRDIAPKIAEQARTGDIRHCVADITKAQQLLDYAPQMTIADGLAELLGWVRDQADAGLVAQTTEEHAVCQLVK